MWMQICLRHALGGMLTNISSCPGAGGQERASILPCWSWWLGNPLQQSLGKLLRGEDWFACSATPEPQLFSGCCASGYHLSGPVARVVDITAWTSTSDWQGDGLKGAGEWRYPRNHPGTQRKSLGAVRPCPIQCGCWVLPLLVSF